MAKRTAGATKPRLGDFGGKDDAKPRSRSTDVTQERDPGFPAHGGPKPMYTPTGKNPMAGKGHAQ
jgi:hypothetical protein